MKREFSAGGIVFNKKGEVLLTKRSLKKPLWPTYWDLSFSSHPWVGENLEEAGRRRAKEELGIKVKGFKDLFSYNYQSGWSDLFSEHEVNHILLATYTYAGVIKPNLDEIGEFFWLGWEQIEPWVNEHHNQVAPWVTLSLRKLHQLPFVYA